jgi:hypothetical protein
MVSLSGVVSASETYFRSKNKKKFNSINGDISFVTDNIGLVNYKSTK